MKIYVNIRQNSLWAKCITQKKEAFIVFIAKGTEKQSVITAFKVILLQ